MAKGKNKQFTKKGKGGRKVEKHAFLKKEWYTLMSPPNVSKNTTPLGWTPANKTIGKKIGVNNVLGRVCECTFPDLEAGSEEVWRKVKMQVETVQGMICYSSFYGLDSTRERVFSLLKKGQSLLDFWVDVKTNDKYILRVFVVACTRRQANQKSNNCYAKSSQVRAMRAKVTKTLSNIAAKKSATGLAQEILTDTLNKTLINQMRKIFPIRVALVTKVKVLKKPNIDAKSLVNNTNSSKARAAKKNAAANAAPAEANATIEELETKDANVEEGGEEAAETEN
jgi:small subunit ribosomal protein S3Ae